MLNLPESERSRLLKNPVVEKITDSHVVYTVEFKKSAVGKYLSGQSPRQIFTDAGINTSYFNEDYAKKSIFRWKKVLEDDGPGGLATEKRGRKASGRPKKVFDPSDLQSVLDRVAYLEAENDFLKKLKALADREPAKKSSR